MINAIKQNLANRIAWLIATVWLSSCCSFETTATEIRAADGLQSRSVSNHPETTIPLWQQGVSSWNGAKYVTPSSGSASKISQVSGIFDVNAIGTFDAQAALGSINSSRPTTPYTVPFDPSMQAIGVGSRNNSSIQIAQSGRQPTLVGPAVNDFEMSGEPDAPYWNNSAPIGQGLATPGLRGGTPYSIDPALPIDAGLIDASQPTFTPPREAGFGSEPIMIENPPLQEQVLRWYEYPSLWMKGWDNNAEFGLNGSSGNADTLAMQTGIELKRKNDLHTFAIDIDYRVATNRRVTTEDNGRFNLDYDRMLNESRWSLFGKYGMEWDKFKAFDLRVNINSGLGYHWFRSDHTTLVTRFGAGASREVGAPDDDWTPEAVFGIEGERQLTSRQKLKAKIDYFPAWDDFTDYRLVSDVSWEILLDGSDNLSLKLAATDRYDSTPQGAEKNDVYYSLLLLYKF